MPRRLEAFFGGLCSHLGVVVEHVGLEGVVSGLDLVVAGRPVEGVGGDDEGLLGAGAHVAAVGRFYVSLLTVTKGRRGGYLANEGKTQRKTTGS